MANDIMKKKVDDIFTQANVCLNEKLIKELKIKVKEKMEQKRQAKKLLANINRELEELRIEVEQELESE